MTSQRSLSARIGGHAYRAKYGDAEIARIGADALLARFEREVDPEGLLTEMERRRRAESARRAHMTRLALASAKARSNKKNGGRKT